jgi:WD40 repeat protein
MDAKRVVRIECEPRSLVAIDAAKSHLVTTLPDGKVTRWNIRKGSCDQLRGHMRRATCMAFSPRSDLLCTGALDTTLRLWNMDGCECIGILEGHEDQITCAAFDSRGRMVCSGSADKSLKLWRVMDGCAMFHIAHTISATAQPRSSPCVLPP